MSRCHRRRPGSAARAGGTVRGRDRRAVEAGQRVADALVPQLDVSAHEVVEEYVVRATVAGSASARSAADELLADPFAQLLAGRAAEGDHQHLIEGGHPLRDVARYQGAHREVLAGACARLENCRGSPVGEGIQDVEGRGVAELVVHRLARSSIGCHSRIARAPSRVLSPSYSSPGARLTEEHLQGSTRHPTPRRARRRRSRRGSGSRPLELRVLAHDHVVAGRRRLAQAWPVFNGSGSGSHWPASYIATRSRSRSVASSTLAKATRATSWSGAP